MKKNLYILVIFVLVVVMLGACSPSAAEVVSTNTPLPPANTPTPIPPTETPTPTPVPYDLDISVVDEDGIPVTSADVTVGEDLYTTDMAGVVSLLDLPGESVDFSVRASGYFPTEVTESLERGENSSEIILAMDPFGLLPVNACAPGESLIYIEDFQDGEAQDWDMNETPPDTWVIEPDPGSPEDLVLKASPDSRWIWLGGRETFALNNTVWRLRLKLEGQTGQHLNFRFLENESTSLRYIVATGQDDMRLGRLESDNWMDLGGNTRVGTDEWHLVEVSFFDGTVALYIDGKENLTWTDPNPWEGGTINIEPNIGDGVIYYNDISICELNASFEPIPRPKTGYNLTATLVDVEGNPISGAAVKLAELGNLEEATQESDDAGLVAWADLPPGNLATLDLNIPGYFNRLEMVEIVKGDNQVSVTLERDPHGLLAVDACAVGETLAFVEDLQDGAMQGWDNLNARLQAGVPNIGIIDDPAMEGNMLLMASSPGPNATVDLGQYETRPFGDAVWRMDVKSWKNMHLHAQWHNDNRSNSYVAFIYGQGENAGRLQKFTGDSNFEVFTWSKRIGGDDQWHTIEISTYQGEFQIWIDGILLGRWTDQDPIPEGYLGIGMDFWAADSLIYFDNISVCELSAPFVSIFASE